MNLQERLVQCRKDKEAISQQEQKILNQMKEKKEPGHGDYLEDRGYKILVIKTDGGLIGFHPDGNRWGGASMKDLVGHLNYKITGNVFNN